MNGDPTVASVIGRDLAGYGARRCFGLLGTANFKVSHALVENGVELDLRASRMQRRQHGRRLCQGDRRADTGQRSFRPGTDQCADRDRRGGKKPDAARGVGRRRADRCGEE